MVINNPRYRLDEPGIGLGDDDIVGGVEGELTLRALDRDGLPVNGRGHTARQPNRPFANTRHRFFRSLR